MGETVIALFGEAERGEVGKPLRAKSVVHLNEQLGHPPGESCGIFFAIQFLLYGQEVIFIRVEEEGFSRRDYLQGTSHLIHRQSVGKLSAICLPGVGDKSIIDATHPLIDLHEALMIITERDLYDYFTAI